MKSAKASLKSIRVGMKKIDKACVHGLGHDICREAEDVSMSP